MLVDFVLYLLYLVKKPFHYMRSVSVITGVGNLSLVAGQKETLQGMVGHI